MSRHLRALLAGLLATLAALIAAPAASATELGLGCDDLISAETRDFLPGSGFERNADTTFTGLDGVDRDYPGGLSCFWGVPQTDNLFWVGVAQVTDEQAATEQAALLAEGYTTRESDGGLLFELDPAANGYLIAPVGLFRDGYWFTSSDYGGLAPAVAAVIGAAASGADDTAADATAEDAECDALLSDNQRRLLAENGIERTNEPIPFGDIGPSDGVYCSWGSALSLGYAVVTDAQAQAVRDAVVAVDFFEQPDGQYAGAGPAWAGNQYFSDGYWFTTYRTGRGIDFDVSAIELRDRILGARATAAPALLDDGTAQTAAFDSDGSDTAATPSALSSLPPAQEFTWTFGRFAALAGAAIVLTALLVLPGKLVDVALEGNYTRLGLPSLRLPATRRARPRRLTIAVGLLLASAISIFVDPAIGVNAMTVRIFLSTLTAVCVESVLGLWLVARVARRVDPAAGPSLRFSWNSLAFIALAVLVSWSAGFEPGMMFGLVIGLGYAREIAPHREHRVVWAEAGIVLAIGLLAYTGYSAFFASASDQPSSVLGVLALYGRESLSALTIATLFALPVVLLPLRGMLGSVLFRRNRLNWFGGYVVAVFFLIGIVLPLDDSWDEVGNTLDQWLWLLGAYVVAAVVVWALLTFLPTPRRMRPEAVRESSRAGAGDDAG